MKKPRYTMSPMYKTTGTDNRANFEGLYKDRRRVRASSDIIPMEYCRDSFFWKLLRHMFNRQPD